MSTGSFYHTTHKKKPTGSLNQTTRIKKWPQAHFFFTTHSKKWLKAHFFRVTPPGVLRGKLPLSSAGEREGAWGERNPPLLSRGVFSSPNSPRMNPCQFMFIIVQMNNTTIWNICKLLNNIPISFALHFDSTNHIFYKATIKPFKNPFV